MTQLKECIFCIYLFIFLIIVVQFKTDDHNLETGLNNLDKNNKVFKLSYYKLSYHYSNLALCAIRNFKKKNF